MTLFAIILFSICCLYITIQLVYLFLLYSRQPAAYPPSRVYPTISILVAARNEEDNILNCLTHLDALDYPKDKIEILIGNDHSDDATQQIAEKFIAGKPHFRLLNLQGDEHPQTRGKARVLAVLGEAAKGDILLITDADITVNSQWAKGMVAALESTGAGMVAGITNICGKKLFARFQQVDWLYFMGIFYTFSDIGKPLSAVGNNMAVLRKAYDATGGYVKIPFSITEDYALFKAVRSQGYTTVQLMNTDTLLESQPMNDLQGLIKQRKRWLVGGWDLPLVFRAMIFVFGAWYVALPLFLFTPFIKEALILLLAKLIIQWLQLLRIGKCLNLNIKTSAAVYLYDFYLFVMIPLTSIAFFLPGNKVWKGRRF